jgi:type IV conjugative transfer system coupling protein TraD
MSHKHRIVEGGQLFMHRVRMFKQTMKLVLSLSAVSILCLLSTLVFWKFDWYDCYMAIMYGWAHTKLSMKVFIPHSYSFIDFYRRDLTLMRVNSINFMSDPYVRHSVSGILETLKEGFYYSPLLVLFSFVGSTSFLGFFSKKQRSSLSSKEILRGHELVSSGELASILRKQDQESDLMLDTLPLVKGKETSHILITGTTGSGKTNCFHTLLPQIRKRGDSAIVFDTTGDLISKYYREGQDLVLNPLDARSQKWNIWEECGKPEDLESFAEAFVPQKANSHDPFWDNASRKILATAIAKTNDDRDIAALYHTLLSADLSSYHDFFEGTDAAAFADKEGGKTTLSIRSAMAAHIACFKYLIDDQGGNFSIRQWIKTDPQDQWLFITSTPGQRQLLRPLMSAWMNTTINSLMSLEPNERRRFWLMVDELPSLNNVPSLKTGLAEFRKYGGCILAGVQSFPQLNEVYGNSASQAMLDLFNTKLMFRTTDPVTSQWVSKTIGETEYAESQESLSFGANSIRDGVSLGRSEKIKQVILPSEVSNLPDLVCIVKYPGNYPSCRTTMTYKDIAKITPPFMERNKMEEEES